MLFSVRSKWSSDYLGVKGFIIQHNLILHIC
jgi:hypothetical protein